MTASGRGFPPLLDENTLQGQYGEDYLRAIASAWGFQHGTASSRDLVKADVTLTLPERVGSSWNPHVWAQVKTTSGGRVVGSSIHYDVDVDTYNVLCRPNDVPRVLVVIFVPAKGPLATVSASGASMVKGAYWTSWVGESESTNTQSVAVALPCAHLLTASEMRRMIASRGSSSTTAVVPVNRFDP